MRTLVVVTGAGGLIGGYVAKSLAARNVHVIGVVRKVSPEYSNAAPDVEWVEWNILSEDVPERLREVIPDLVYHAATANDIVSRDREAGYRLSLFGTNRVFEWAKSVGANRFLFLSTFQVYGQELQGQISEETKPELNNDYGLNHHFGELFLELRAKEHEIGVVALRPTNVYGVPWCSKVNRWTLVPMCFCRDAIMHQSIEIRSSGRQMRNFVHLSRLAIAAESALDQDLQGFQILNVASPHQHSIREVAERVKEQYSRMFNSDLIIDIQSDEPTVSNEFRVLGESWDRFTQAGSRFDDQVDQLSSVIKETLERIRSWDRAL